MENASDFVSHLEFFQKYKRDLKGYLPYKTIFCHKVALDV